MLPCPFEHERDQTIAIKLYFASYSNRPESNSTSVHSVLGTLWGQITKHISLCLVYNFDNSTYVLCQNQNYVWTLLPILFSLKLFIIMVIGFNMVANQSGR